MSNRYFVRKESSILGVFFVVIDGSLGQPVGAPRYFIQDAEELAAKLNFRETYKEMA